MKHDARKGPDISGPITVCPKKVLCGFIHFHIASLNRDCQIIE